MTLRVNNLSFNYNSEVSVFKNISFSIEKGEFTSLLGTNGAGKTTLFKLILGFLKPKEGNIYLDDIPLDKYKIKEKAKKIAYIPQFTQTAFPYTVFNTVLMGTSANLSTLRKPKKKEEDLVLEILDSLKIIHLKDKKVSEISGGERQLALIGRALAQNAKILILDEITSNLDYGNRTLVLDILKDLSRSGYSILLSTHNPEAALIYSDKIITLDKGKISFTGAAKELSENNILSHLYKTPISVRTLEQNGKTHYICIPE